MHNMSKKDLPITNSICEKVWFTIYGLSQMLCFNFCLFDFPNFKWLFLVRGSLWSSITPQVFFFDLYIFGSQMAALLYFIEIWSIMHFVSFFFLVFFSKWKKYYNLPFDNIVKMYYLLNMPFRFFFDLVSFIFILTRLSLKTYEKRSF